MWLRDAALEGRLPTIEELTWNPYIFPYRFGHAIWSFIGERWGDAAVGEVLHAVAIAGMEDGFKRALGMSLEDLSDEWRESVQRTYLPQIAELQPARRFAQALLTERRSSGTYHVSPALSPDGKAIAYLSEGNSFFVDLYLADGETGRGKRRLIKSAFSSDFESLRFIYSTGSWSPDGRYFAIAAKHGGQDDLVVFDVQKKRVHQRIRVPLQGITNPSWSPDGAKIVFTGYDGGLSDLFVVGADGTGLTRLTRDRFAELHPVWSPDGTTIAFATDRGGQTNLEMLFFRPLRLALYHLADGRIELLDEMSGENINPQWAPDGQSLAFISDRTGIPNVFLYDLSDRQVYQLTNAFTGIAGITPISPAISWAGQADRLAITYYEKGAYNVYVIDNPRSLKRLPYRPPARLVAQAGDSGRADSVAPPPPTEIPSATPLATASVYRFQGGFRASASDPGIHGAGPEPISVKALLDSATIALPDTSEFTLKRYSAKLAPDYVVQPSVGYQRDNFGNGFFGGTAISLSDMLGNHRVLLAGEVNGRIEEAQVLGAYANLTHRVNWAAGYQQNPIFFYSGSMFQPDSGKLLTRLDRYIVHQAFAEASRPFSRFQRLELGVRATNVSRSFLEFSQYFDPSGFLVDERLQTSGQGSVNYIHLRGPVHRSAQPVGVRAGVRGLAVPPVPGRRSPLRPDPGPHRAGQPIAVLRPVRARRQPVSHVPGQHRTDPRIHGGFPAPQRVRHRPGRLPVHHGVLRAGSTDRLPHRRGQSGAAVPAHQQPHAGRAPGAPAAHRRGVLLRRGTGLGPAARLHRWHHRVAPDGRECRRGAAAAAQLGHLHPGQPAGVHRAAGRLRQAAGPARDAGLLDAEHRADVLIGG
jgi:hypothetical protein